MAESENQISTDDTDTIDTLEETSITMVDILAHENELEEEYAAVLGASDDKCCTYTKGPIKRQALYSCLTCCPESVKNLEMCAGICLACSLHCHENHELVELYTKRNFRCDCPTERFPGLKCTLNPDIVDGDKKMPKNDSNLYNQNFQGVYCTCKRPYPDPESPIEEVMLQCAICEDWYHLHHLGLKVKKLRDDYHEMVCPGCMQKYEFLQDYTGLALTRLEDLDESDVSVETDDKLKSDLDKSISEIMNMSGDDESSAADASTSEKADGDGKAKNGVEPPAKRQKTDGQSGCRRPKNKPDWDKDVATLWLSDWRLALCKCKECLPLYEATKITFLLDPEDSATHYEERGRKSAKESSYEQGIRALSTIGRTQQIDAITEYNRMKDKLKDFLHTFVVNKKVVTEEDINRFFQEMKNEKNANLGQPFFCR
ncbi:putative E3 ubiquitin-protein ligase UBR7 [Episyrphus balteatus]|uniref:putative E3 ubiquitin-protein ligase UBR7 n=1 Tax=Episyrphus balteatus TaxID=286459 RepID=UPI002485336F|nr:putative E3 ubiquitin-protein ligase UBR7 [Episyrphus balteatus]